MEISQIIQMFLPVTNLAPGTDYNFEVVPFNKHFEGLPASVTVRTQGEFGIRTYCSLHIYIIAVKK